LSKKHTQNLVIEDDLNERYVACLLLYAEAEGIEVDEAHDDVTAFLKEYELDVDRTNIPLSKNKRYH
jgi:hypothetical protein|tara:strand:+ start:1205 stop:1405 length:201 start_codon:yes stop_codon:yes gene_type:complete